MQVGKIKASVQAEKQNIAFVAKVCLQYNLTNHEKMKIILSTLFLIGFVCPVSAQELTEPQKAAVDGIMAEYDQAGHPGAAVAIVRGGKTAYAQGYGLANIENNIPFTPETVSDIGSVAKQITAFAIIRLAQEGKLALDDDIRKYLPEVPDFGRPIRIVDLIHHTSGLREIYGAWAIAGGRSGDGILQEDALYLAQRSKELNFPPNTRHMYCNTGYMLLADIISRVSGMPFETWMRTHIFQPLGMDHTFIMDERGEVFPGAATSYETSPKNGFRQIFDNSTVQGAGGIYTTIPDLVKWLNNYRDPKIGGQKAVEQMLERGVLNNGDTLAYAFGLTVGQYRGLRLIRHTGSSAGYRAVFTWLPDQDLGIVVKSNFAGFAGSDLSNRMIDLLLGPVLGPAPAATGEEDEDGLFSFVDTSPEYLNAYTGKYYCPELETVYEIRMENGGLVGGNWRHRNLPLKFLGEDYWEDTEGPLGEIRFERDEKGRVTGMRVTGGGVVNLWMERGRGGEG